MNLYQPVLMDACTTCSADHLVDVSGLRPEELALLIDNGVIAPVDPLVAVPVFHMHYLVIALTARRLRDDFELDGHGLALALTLLRRLDQAESELAAARAQLSGLFPT